MCINVGIGADFSSHTQEICDDCVYVVVNIPRDYNNTDVDLALRLHYCNVNVPLCIYPYIML